MVSYLGEIVQKMNVSKNIRFRFVPNLLPARPDPTSLGINIHESERSSVLHTSDLYSFKFF